jgi:hypothetical protein
MMMIASFSVFAQDAQEIKVKQEGEKIVVQSCVAGAECESAEIDLNEDAEQSINKLTKTLNEACETECDVVEEITLKERLDEAGTKIRNKARKIKRDSIAIYHVSRKIVLALYYKARGNDAAGMILMY